MWLPRDSCWALPRPEFLSHTVDPWSVLRTLRSQHILSRMRFRKAFTCTREAPISVPRPSYIATGLLLACVLVAAKHVWTDHTEVKMPQMTTMAGIWAGL